MESLDELTQELLDPAATSFADVVRMKARFEWAFWARTADEVVRREAQVEAGAVPTLMKQVETSAIPGDLGREAALSEATVVRTAAKARRLRDKTPGVWAAFERGGIDAVKAGAIAGAVDRLRLGASVERLDRQVVSYAERHTAAELRRWLKLFVARVEPDLFNERAHEERERRGVDVVHGDEGMSWLTIYNSSVSIAAIDKRATKEARAFGADDPRTLDQRKADLITSWATTNEHGGVAPNADVAVLIQASTLAGADDLPAVSADGAWVIPAAWAIELALRESGNTFWHRVILDPVTEDILAHDYAGRFAPSVLSKGARIP